MENNVHNIQPVEPKIQKASVLLADLIRSVMEVLDLIPEKTLERLVRTLKTYLEESLEKMHQPYPRSWPKLLTIIQYNIDVFEIILETKKKLRKAKDRMHRNLEGNGNEIG